MTTGLVLAYFSAQNIDRFVTFFRASKRAGRTFIADLYLAHILDALGRKSLPSPRGDDLRIFLPSTMKRKIVRERSFDLIAPYYRSPNLPGRGRKTSGRTDGDLPAFNGG